MTLESLLQKKKMRQADLARACNISRSTVTRHMSGKVEPKTKVLMQYSRVLGVPVEKLAKIFLAPSNT